MAAVAHPNVTYASDNTHGIATVYDWEYNDKHIKTIKHGIVWPSFGDEYTVPKNQGDQVKVQRLTALTVSTTPLAEVTPPDGQYMVKTALFLDVQEHGEAVYVSQRLQDQDADDNIDIAAELLGEWAANVLDLKRRADLCGGTNVWYVQDFAGDIDGADAGDVNGGISIELLEKMILYADDNRLRSWQPAITASTGVGTRPIPRGVPVIISSKHKFDLRNLIGETIGFTPAHLYPAEDRIHPMEVGSYDRLRFVLTDNPMIALGAGGATGAGTLFYDAGAAGACDVYSMVMVGKHAYATSKILALDLQEGDESDEAKEGAMMHGFARLYYKQPGSGGATGDPIDQVASVGTKFYDIGGLLITEHVLEVQTVCTRNGSTS